MNLHDATELAYKNGFDAGRPKWIPVSEKLPEPTVVHDRRSHPYKSSDEVLCVCVQQSGKRMVKTGRCEFYGDTNAWRLPGNIDSVTHWMPKPELPKEGA